MTRVLVPLAVLEGESVPIGLVELLGPVEVTILGYHVLPEQTPPDQARVQYGDRAVDALADLAAEFQDAGSEVEYRLVFTHDREQTIDRVADETGTRAYVITGITGPVERLFVPLTGDVTTDRILSFVVELIDDRDIDVTLFLATEARDRGEELLEVARTTLTDRGIEADSTLVVTESPIDAITGAPFEALVEAAVDHDAIVMGQRAPSLQSFLFGEEPERVAAESVGPVLVVREHDRTASSESG
ncbi:universal stress protein [Natrialbaceae archaeon A-gly3]